MNPVSLQIFSTATSKNRDFNCPKWLGDEQEFVADTLWATKGRGLSDPFAKLASLKKCVVSATKGFFAKSKERKKSFSSNSARISRASCLLRLLRAKTQSDPHISKALDADPELAEIVSWDDINEKWDEGRLSQWVHAQLLELVMEKKNDDNDPDDPASTFKQGLAQRKMGPVETLKNLVPCSRERLTALRSHESDAPTTDPAVMGGLIINNWTQLWTATVRQVCLLYTSDAADE